MLMALGPVVFDRVANLLEFGSDSEVVFAKHDVIGAGPIYEATGGDGGSIQLSGVIKPEHFGVNGALATLEAAQASQIPLPLMRGDFRPIGWVLIQKLNRRDNELNGFGLGREITFDITLIKVGSPASSFAPSILSLF